ncbi:hypothetical protein PPROV_000751700 [Pycnococcus provasolii]|uniref:Uncharacterized protein n=1 Tax=Pycnococcus provasolii TaxID=41880 RepID=A0A830HSQ9_9CHLO|nr:hypothetical protein PPROV_000751700 [Pycnococcus provasolii]
MPKPCEGDRRAASRAHLSLQAREQRRGPPRQCPQRAAARERCDSSSHRSRQSPASKVSSIVHGGLAEGRRQDHRRTPSRVHECVQLKRVGYQRRFSQHAGVRSERLDGPDVGKPKPKPDPKGQDRPEMHQATVYPPRLGEKNKGEFVWPKDLFTLGPSARYLFAIPGSCETCHAVNVVPSGGSEQSVQLFCRLVWSLWYGLCERSMVAPLQILDNPNLTSVDLSALKEAGEIDISNNPKLVDVKLSELTTVAAFLGIDNNDSLEQLSLPKLNTTDKLSIRDNENLVGISMPVLETSSNQFWVLRNPALQTLCAPNLVDGGSDFDGVCIGDKSDQPSLDADLSSLVTGFFSEVFTDVCYGGGTDPPLEADNICGVEPGGLFTTAGCSVTSKACKNPKKTKKGKNNKP